MQTPPKKTTEGPRLPECSESLEIQVCEKGYPETGPGGEGPLGGTSHNPISLSRLGPWMSPNPMKVVGFGGMSPNPMDYDPEENKIPKLVLGRAVFWRPGAPKPKNHTYSGREREREWLFGLGAPGLQKITWPKKHFGNPFGKPPLWQCSRHPARDCALQQQVCFVVFVFCVLVCFCLAPPKNE